ncbi:MAG TPA: glycine cleavage system protein GcvH [Spirochaetes bacterium]|nr:glycine cleavage system protein GcvH [Spirochaetota bacterium]
MELPKGLRYTSEHEWVLVEAGVATVGVTDHAQQMLGDVVFVEMPEIGTEIIKDETFGVIESVKAASDIFAPVSGEVAEINEELGDHPEFINQSPYEKGWIIRVEMSNRNDVDDLMVSDKYREFLVKEAGSDMRFVDTCIFEN